MRAHLIPALAGAVLLAIGCHGNGGSTTGSSSGGHGGGGGTGGGSSCPVGQIAGDDGACITVGIQGCATMFVDPDGLCRPSLARCPAGTIPRIDTGCVPVGIQGCAAEMMESDGLCHPAMSKCPAGTFALPQKGCVPIDGPGCGTGTWGDIPAGAGNVYVDLSYAGGASDGSQTAPFTTIAAALTAAPDGGRIALAAGTYHEHFTLSKPVEIAGRCPSMVIIDGDDGDPDAPTVIRVDAGPSIVRGVTLAGHGRAVRAGAQVTVDRVHITGAVLSALVAIGAPSTITNSFVEGTTGLYGQFGLGLNAGGGATVTIADSAFYQNRVTGLTATDAGTSLTVTDTLVDSTLPEESDQKFGEALVVELGAHLSITDSALVASRVSGFFASDMNTHMEATRILVERTLPDATTMSAGLGAFVDGGATLELTSSVIAHNSNVGIFVLGAGTTGRLSGNLIADTASDPGTGQFGRGMVAQQGATVDMRDDALVRNHDTAIVASQKGTTVTVTHDVVEDTSPQDVDAQYGAGAVSSQAHLTLTSVTIARSHVAALLVVHGEAHVNSSLFSHVDAGSFTLLNPTRTYTGIGDGLVATAGATVTVKGTRVEDCVRAGLLFDSSAGSISLASSTKNAFGLVIDGMPTPTVDSQSSFAGNMKAKHDDADLPVPQESAPVPPP